MSQSLMIRRAGVSLKDSQASRPLAKARIGCPMPLRIAVMRLRVIGSSSAMMMSKKGSDRSVLIKSGGGQGGSRSAVGGDFLQGGLDAVVLAEKRLDQRGRGREVAGAAVGLDRIAEGAQTGGA